MTPLSFLFEAFARHHAEPALVWRDRAFSYAWLEARVRHWMESLAVAPGTIVSLEADFSPNSIALLLSLVERGCVVVPLTPSVEAKKAEFLEIAGVELRIIVEPSDEIRTIAQGPREAHSFYRRLRELRHPGLVLFSSGSTGNSKAAVHDLVGLLEKFRTTRPKQRAVSFLLYDHIGGFNTLLFSLSSGGCLVTLEDRSPDAVLAAIAKHRVELLPTSPTFINLLLLGHAHERHDTSSLRTITYGTEPMAETTLRRLAAAFPDVKLQQTYGLSELGILRSKSRASDSLWVRVGGEGFETRVVDGILHVKARSAMLGYLNAPSPFVEDGWFVTGDAVEQDGEWLRILGRQSELIFVAGEKVYPAEIESVILELDNVVDVTVHGVAHPITGHVVAASVTVAKEEDERALALRVKKHCAARLQRFKVPVRVSVRVGQPRHGDRFKKLRSGGT